jgi:LysR family transcriptional regulator, hydrogen peroxide-inducible genes activator
MQKPPQSVLNNTLRQATQLSLKQLLYLVTLEQTMNFTRAAQRCFVTQSTLSGGLQELENTLGVTLVERNRQSLLFTPLGHAVAAHARQILSDAADLMQRCHDAQDPLRGTLVLGAIPTIAPFFLPPLVRGLRQSLPDLRVILREDPTATLLRALEDGEIDMALIALPMDVGRLRAEVLFSEELWLVTSSLEAASSIAPPKLAKLDMQRLMLLGEGHCLSDHTLQACSRAQRGHPNAASEIEATSLATLVQMVESGLGVALLPEMAIKSNFLNQISVTARPLAAPAPKRDIALVTRPTRARNAVEEEVRRIALSVGKPAPMAAKRSRRSAKTA